MTTTVQPITVLLVEDDPGDELMTREAFEHNKVGNALHVVRDGAEALDFLYRRGDHAAAPRPDLPFNPNIHDGLRTRGLAIDKTNWAQKLDTPPYEAYGVTSGVTFTFGGLKVSNDTEVQDAAGAAIPGLFAAGEIIGGLYYHNYASGTGLMAGGVFGRIAGRSAAAYTKGVR